MKDLLKNPTGKNRHGHEKNPDSNAKKCSEVKCAGDPVDVATGRMLLPQTDIVLPGSPPLVFERVFDSSYRAGRWFGTGWSSTVDQRLEIDAEGVVFSCDEGSLLAYPHPAPGVPVMPTHGRRWPLDRVDDGYTVTDPETGRVRHFVDHPSGELALLAQIDDRNGRWITFEYDETGAPTSIVHQGGYHLKLTTNDGRVTALHLAGAAPDGTDQEILRYSYTNGHLTEVTNSSGRPLRFGCDELGRITSWTDTNGSRYEYVYDEHDRCVYQTGTNGHLEAHFTWDDTDPDTGLRMTSMTDGLGHTKRYVINDRSQVVAEVDPLGAVTRFEYDRHHRLLSVTDTLGRVTRSTYDEHGRLTSVVRPDGRELTADYNALGLPVRFRGAEGMVTRQTYDERGNRLTTTDPSGATIRTTYDAVGRPTSMTDALGNTMRIRSDAAGLPIEITDPLGAASHVVRDAFGRPVTLTNPLGAVTRLDWTREGKLSRRTEADGSTQSWTYDGEGNCLTHTDAVGAVSRFEYSHFDLMTARTGPDGVRYEFTHDHGLRLTQVRNPHGLIWQYAYDAAGHLISETDFDNRTLTYERDAHIGDTLTLANQYDPIGRLTAQRITGPDNRSIQRRDYTYRADGLLTGLTDQLSGPKTFDLDTAGRVTAVHAANWTERYAYDAAGNQTEASWPASHPGQEAVGSRSYSGTAITHAGTIRYEHDGLGRITLRQKTRLSRKPDTWRYEWDAEDRLTSVTTPDGTRWHYRYDPLGRRICKQRVGTDGKFLREEVTFTWDDNTLCEQATRSQNMPYAVALTWEHNGLHPLTQTERIISPDDPQRIIDERFFSIVTDLIGTPKELIDDSGQVAWWTRTTLWGTTTWNSASSTYTPLRFPGQYFDAETSLHYNLFRYYDPETARYLSSDPLGLSPTPHPITYVKNPHAWSDPLGLAPCPYMDIYPSGKGIVADLDAKGIMSLVIEKGPDTPRGSEMFDNAIRSFGNDVQGVKGYWQNGGTLRDNLDSFNSAARNAPPGDMRALETAARSTFTGKMAARHGFTDVEIVELRGPHGDYSNVGVIFRPPSH
ncbi:DUF6531 domain-containing protein [Streptomyces atratus]|uniref:DUF6531 domain-containing protein n=1 Tax=Streptomyces atratus TaxID=1893 RepID=UPI003F6A2AE2